MWRCLHRVPSHDKLRILVAFFMLLFYFFHQVFRLTQWYVLLLRCINLHLSLTDYSLYCYCQPRLCFDLGFSCLLTLPTEHFLLILQAESFRSDAYIPQIAQLDSFISQLICQSELKEAERTGHKEEEKDSDDEMCCICYESVANARLVPCSHKSCYGCITRHLLNCQRCFFCKASISEVIQIGEEKNDR